MEVLKFAVRFVLLFAVALLFAYLLSSCGGKEEELDDCNCFEKVTIKNPNGSKISSEIFETDECYPARDVEYRYVNILNDRVLRRIIETEIICN